MRCFYVAMCVETVNVQTNSFKGILKAKMHFYRISD